MSRPVPIYPHQITLITDSLFIRNDRGELAESLGIQSSWKIEQLEVHSDFNTTLTFSQTFLARTEEELTHFLLMMPS